MEEENHEETYEEYEAPMQSVVLSRHVFFVLGAGMDKFLPILPYKKLKTEMRGMEDVFQEIYKISLSQLYNYEGAKEKLGSYALKFLNRYHALEKQEEWYESIKKLGIPYENIHIKCYKQAFINIVKSYIGLTPLKLTRTKNSEITESLYEEILGVSEASEVIVIGYSYGGAIINRVALLMHQRLSTPPPNVFFLGFGSIYIPRKRYEPFNVNLINYLSLGDVAMKTNGLRSPKFLDLNKAFLDMSLMKWNSYVRKYPDVESLPPIICSFQNNQIDDTEGTLRWICLFNNHKPLCIVNGRQRKISVLYWKEHNYTNLMEFILLLNQQSANFISDIKDFNNYIIDYSPINYSTQTGGLTKRNRKIKRQTKKAELVNLI
jgi:hypothetical protein